MFRVTNVLSRKLILVPPKYLIKYVMALLIDVKLLLKLSQSKYGKMLNFRFITDFK